MGGEGPRPAGGRTGRVGPARNLCLRPGHSELADGTGPAGRGRAVRLRVPPLGAGRGWHGGGRGGRAPGRGARRGGAGADRGSGRLDAGAVAAETPRGGVSAPVSRGGTAGR